ncbi:MAG: metallophosphoesterase, partial [Verrucomicrobiota bacterium]
GDIHIWRIRLIWSELYYLKRILGPVNLLLNRRKKFPPAYGEAVVAEILKQEADLVVFSGDMSTQSLEPEFERCAELFAPIRDKWGERFFAIPGNHDRYSPGSERAGYYETFFPYAVSDPGSKIHTLELNEDWAVIGIDCSRPFKFRSNGLFTEEDEQALDAALTKQGEAGRRVILVCHFYYVMPAEEEKHWYHHLINDERMEQLVAKHKPVLYLHGHKHIRWWLQSPKTPDTECIDCGSAGTTSESEDKQAGFVRIRLADDGMVEQVESVVLQADGSFLRSPMERTACG